MIDLINRQATIDEINLRRKVCADKWQEGLRMALYVLVAMPSAQPKIIQCKDCKNWDITWENNGAKNYHYCPLIDKMRHGDWFCADAERRTDE